MWWTFAAPVNVWYHHHGTEKPTSKFNPCGNKGILLGQLANNVSRAWKVRSCLLKSYCKEDLTLMSPHSGWFRTDRQLTLSHDCCLIQLLACVIQGIGWLREISLPAEEYRMLITRVMHVIRPITPDGSQKEHG